MAKLKKISNDTETNNIKPLFSIENIGKMGKEYAEVSAKIKQLEERKKFLADTIKNGVEQYGVKDDKGSYYLEDDSLIMGKVAKKSFKVDQEKAVEILESMGLGDVIDVVTTKVVNEDRLQSAVQDRRITLDVVQDFTNESVSYSVSVKEKAEMPEVEQSNLQVARKKKR